MSDNVARLGRSLSQFGRSRLLCSKSWFPDVHTTPARELLHLAMGTAEEGGEVLGVVKKWHRYTDDVSTLDRAKLHEELGDLLVYVAMLGEITEIDWEGTLTEVFAKCVARWGAP